MIFDYDSMAVLVSMIFYYDSMVALCCPGVVIKSASYVQCVPWLSLVVKLQGRNCVVVNCLGMNCGLINLHSLV